MQIVVVADIHGNIKAFEATLEYIDSLKIDEMVIAGYGTERSDPLWETDRFGPLHWVIDQLSEDERDAIGKLPKTIQLPDLLIVHASCDFL